MLDTDPTPSTSRLAAAAILTPALVSVGGAIYIGIGFFKASSFLADVLIFSAFGAVLMAYPMTLLIGLPAYFHLRKRRRITALTSALLGIGLGEFSMLIVALGLEHSGPSGYRAILFYPAALSGLPLVVEVGLVLAALGAFGGLVFWLIAAARLRQSV